MTTEDELREELRQYNSRLLDYAESAEAALADSARRERAPYDEVLTVGRMYFVYMSWLADRRALYGAPPAVAILFAKAATSLAGVHNSLSAGYRGEAVSSTHTILDADISLRVIMAGNVAERASLFEGYQHVQRWQNYRSHIKLLETNELPMSLMEAKFTPQQIAGLQRNYERVRDDYHPTRPQSWAWKVFKDELKKGEQVSIAFLARKVGRWSDYVQFFSPASISTHAAPLVENSLVSPKTGRLSLGPIFDRMTAVTMSLAAGYAYSITDQALRVAAPPDAEALLTLARSRLSLILLAANPRADVAGMIADFRTTPSQEQVGS